jgi:hypothetical protein
MALNKKNGLITKLEEEEFAGNVREGCFYVRSHQQKRLFLTNSSRLEIHPFPSN